MKRQATGFLHQRGQMSPEAAKTDRPIQYFDEWNPPEPPTDLIFDDGVPLESNRHRIAMNVLIDSALNVLQETPNSFGAAICSSTTAAIRR